MGLQCFGFVSYEIVIGHYIKKKPGVQSTWTEILNESGNFSGELPKDKRTQGRRYPTTAEPQ